MAVVILTPGPGFLFDIRYHLQHGYVPIGWRKQDRILRTERPVLFWLLTKGRLIVLGITLALSLVFLLTVFL